MSQTKYNATTSLLKGLRSLLASLPSDEEKQELVIALANARTFLDEVQLLVESFPTIESSRSVTEALSRLDILAYKTANNDRLKSFMGLKASRKASSIMTNGSTPTEERASQLRKRLEKTSRQDPLRVMEESRATVAVLVSLAASLGLRTRKKEKKSELMNRIATHITNNRGYKILRGEVAG